MKHIYIPVNAEEHVQAAMYVWLAPVFDDLFAVEFRYARFILPF
jgi:hypothetical protein